MRRDPGPSTTREKGSSSSEPKIVRIWLPPSPPPEMDEPRRSERLKEREDVVVSPREPVQLSQKSLGSGSHWGADELELLKVKFDPDDKKECLEVLSEDPEWLAEQHEKIETYGRQLRDIGADIKSASSDYLLKNAPTFLTFFETLRELVGQNVPNQQSVAEPLKPSASTEPPANIPLSPPDADSLVSQPPTSSKKRSLSSATENESPVKVRAVSPHPEYASSQPQENPPRTPDRLIRLKNPEFTGDSIEYTLEENSKDMIKQFIQITLSVLDSQDIAKIKWPTAAKHCQLRLSAHEQMTYFLKDRKVKAINDGSIIIRHSKGIWHLPDNQGHFLKSVVSIEAKSKKKKDDWTLAGQIFCEMLGHVCHPQFYSLDPNQYLEAFVIHVRHTHVRLFYSQFPISYLRNIAKHGDRYLQNVPNPQGVELQHTKRYELRDPSLRQEFFEMLCRLVAYLSSGKSHVPFLWDFPENALHTNRWNVMDVHRDDGPQFWEEPLATWSECEYPRHALEEESQDSSRPSTSSEGWSKQSYDPDASSE